MSDVSVVVMVDGRTVYSHGLINAPEPHTPVLAGLMAATAHFQALRATATPPAPPSLAAAGQLSGQLAQSTEQKGPSL